MSWQPGDVSPDARRAAEAAADAAGVPLKEWFAEAVRAALMREFGRIPAEDHAPGVAAEKEEPLELTAPAIEPDVSLPATGEAPEHPYAPSVGAPEPGAPLAIAEPEFHTSASAETPAPADISEPEPDMPEPVPAAEPSAAAPIAELEPPAPVVAAELPPVAPIFEPDAPGAVRAAPATVARRPASLDPRRLSDSGFSSWLAGRIQGLPSPATSIPNRDAQPIAAGAPLPSAPAPSRPRLDPVPPALVPAPPASQPPPLQAARAAETLLPLSLPTGPVKALRLASVQAARVRARRSGDADPAIPALAASVASQGVREPILVRRSANNADQYEVVAGERRRAAAARAGRADLPAVVVEADDAETLMLSLAENLGRGDFSPLDEARAYLRLLTEYRVNPVALAQRLARERSHIALALRLLGLPPPVRQIIDSGRLAPAQAFTLLGAPDPEALAGQMIRAAGDDAARGSA